MRTQVAPLNEGESNALRGMLDEPAPWWRPRNRVVGVGGWCAFLEQAQDGGMYGCIRRKHGWRKDGNLAIWWRVGSAADEANLL